MGIRPAQHMLSVTVGNRGCIRLYGELPSTTHAQCNCG